ncbi:HNH endonuclease signature motif containing protein [Arthrobacter sp. B0490]|uniref:HNH endonuclease signature motif containing protein n=1 Tax=Arthrobacter sp. B0490 TaxID=2058891 RepID=UPI000CE43CAF|nr:HNH endonuclease signature motif containing protein [Arthrobacter sp. B0490]
MRTTAGYRAECERIDARILFLAAEKARIDADLATATEELHKLLEDEFFDYQSGGQPGEQPPEQRARRRRTNLADTTTATELACLLRIPERTAHRFVQHSAVLVNHHPRTLAALRAGTISWAHATTLVHEYTGLPDATAALLEDQLLPLAAETTTSRLAVKARTLRTRLHPDTLHQRAATATSRRRVDLEPDHDAMAWLHVHLPAADATAIDARLTTTARSLQTPTEPRTLTQLRTDILTDLLLTDPLPCPGCTGCPDSSGAGTTGSGTTGSGTTGSGTRVSGTTGTGTTVSGTASAGGTCGGGCCAGASGPRVGAHVNVTVPVLTLLGVDDAPADLEGYGPIPADIARRLAAHAPSFTRILTHPETGAVLSVGRSSYAVPADLKRWLRVRDQTCRHPGCSIPASRCDLDHTVPWSHQGRTDATNLASLCRKHHMLKTQGIWHYTQNPDASETPGSYSTPGALTATSPTGRTYITEPDPPPF